MTGELFPLLDRLRLSGRLRASFATTAGHRGCADRLIKAYMGRIAGDILVTHYRRIDLNESRTVSGPMENGARATPRTILGNISETKQAQPLHLIEPEWLG